MSIQVLRDGQLERRRNERQALLCRRSSRLRALNAVTAALTHHVGLPSAIHTDFDANPPPPLTSQEAQLLDTNDIDKGRYFSDSSFPFSLDSVKDALARAFSIPLAARKPQARLVSPGQPDQSSPVPEEDAKGARTRMGSDDLKTPGEATHAQSEFVADGPTPRKGNAVSTSTPGPTAGSLSSSDLPRTSSPTSIDTKQTSRVASSSTSITTTTAHKSESDTLKDQDGDIKLPDSTESASTVESKSTAPVVDNFKVPAQRSEAVADSPITGVQDPKPTTPMVPNERPQRMQTRVSSGAMRQKSVSEIMQESPRATPKRKPPPLIQQSSPAEMSPSRPASAVKLQSVSMPAPPVPSRPTLTLTSDLTDADSTLPLDDDAYASLRGADDDPSRDYLEPLYRIQAQEPPNARGFGELLHRASKSLSTGDQFVAYRERQDQRILKRIYSLQYANHWSLRQMQPCQEPPAPVTHWDHVMSEMKWMRTDFKQERKEKKLLAKYFAYQCAEWLAAEPTVRFEMQVRTKVPMSARSEEFHDAPQSPAATTMENGEGKTSQDEAVPDLEPSGGGDQTPSSSQDMPLTPQYAAVPDALFTAAGMSELTSHMLESDDFTKAMQDLPLYAPFADDLAEQRNTSTGPKWPASISKYITGKVLAKTSPAPRKRSRFDYEDEDSDNEERETKRQRASIDDCLAPELSGVALFAAENKHIKDRLHATNLFRPPSEFNMPAEKFYEYRLASQWTWDDDQKLQKVAKDYAFNWSLISDQMRLPSHFHGAADRRTPWECFERWVELETLPVELRKTTYFRAWVQRLEGAARLVDAKYQHQLSIHAKNPNPTQPPMKRRTLPVRVERRRTGRYLHIIDSMRKLARKREQQAHKQLEAQKAANMRKNHVETSQPKSNIHTPKEFSRLRHDRDMQILAREQKLREAMLAQQKANQMQRAGQHQNQAAMAAQQSRQGTNQMAQSQNGQVSSMQGQANMAGQPRQANGMPASSMQAQNGHLTVPNMGMQNGVPQAPTQANMRSPGGGAMPMSQEAMQRMVMQSQIKNPTQLSAQQLKQYQQQQQMMSPSGSHMMNGMVQSGQMSNNQAAMLAAMQQQGGQANMNNMQGHAAQINGANASVSPNMAPPNQTQPKQLSSGHVPAITQIKHRLQSQNPNLTPQQLDQMANEQMKQQFAARQNAVNAATGSYGNANKQNVNMYDQNQGAFLQNGQMNGQNLNSQMNGFGNMAPGANVATAQNTASPSQQQQYSQMMHKQLMAQQRQAQGMNNNSSPRLQNAGPVNTQSPVNMHVSPVMQGVVPNMNGMNMNMNMAMGGMGGINGMNGVNGGTTQQRPSSRNAAPGMARIPSGSGMGSPGLPHQGSPRAQMVKQ